MTNKMYMSWGDRFAVIDRFAPSDEQIRAAFNVTQDELDTARSLREAGTFVANKNLDTSKYTNVFSSSDFRNHTTRGISTSMTAPTKAPTATTHTMPEAVAKPETASKPVKQPQKRGRKGDKILKALQSVPSTQMPVDAFMQQHDVSLAVLRQAKRFVAGLDPAQAQAIGKINVRQDKATKTLMIWREEA